MADAKKCDICGKFYVPPLGSTLKAGYSLMCSGTLTLDIYDLCDECNKELNEFVESMKEKKNGNGN